MAKATPSNEDRSPLFTGNQEGEGSGYGAIEEQNVANDVQATTEDNKKDPSLMTVIRELSWRKRFIVITLMVVNFSSTACFSIMAPFLPLESDSKGINSTAVGIIFASFELVMLVASLICGRYLTTIGARFMYISGILMASTCTVLFGILEWCPPGTIFFVMAMSCRVVEAIGSAMCQTASTAILANEFSDRVATVIGLLESVSGLGFMAAPPLGFLK